MKSKKKIVVLSVALCIILGGWLLPGINKAEQNHYVRYYEDVDASPYELIVGDTTSKQKRKKYRKERIEPGKTRSINAKTFSRAVQFFPEMEPEDSIQLVEKDAMESF